MEPHGSQPIVTACAPLGDSQAGVIMVHGRKATPRDILMLGPGTRLATATYLAPAAAERTNSTPNTPTAAERRSR